MKVVIPDRIDITTQAVERIKQLTATIYDDTPSDEATIIERIKDAEIITANYIDMTSDIIDAATKLKYIVVPAVGYEWVDYKHAATKGIKVINCPTHNSRAVAEHAIALMMATARRVNEASQDLKAGNWRPRNFEGFEVGGKKLGLIGYGNIAKNVESMAKGLGMTVSFVNSKSSAKELDELLSESDVVVLCLSLNPSSNHLLDAERLKRMKSGAILVNVARGSIVDQPALVTALRENKIAGAGLDVFENEPLVGTPTDEIVDLAKLPHVVATPHMAYNTPETASRLGDELLANLKACLDDRPINVVSE
jgi:phosphoglycerate dehydrogenase-like enzyme